MCILFLLLIVIQFSYNLYIRENVYKNVYDYDGGIARCEDKQYVFFHFSTFSLYYSVYYSDGTCIYNDGSNDYYKFALNHSLVWEWDNCQTTYPSVASVYEIDNCHLYSSYNRKFSVVEKIDKPDSIATVSLIHANPGCQGSSTGLDIVYGRISYTECDKDNDAVCDIGNNDLSYYSQRCYYGKCHEACPVGCVTQQVTMENAESTNSILGGLSFLYFDIAATVAIVFLILLCCLCTAGVGILKNRNK